jgi:hypothetical protein
MFLKKPPSLTALPNRSRLRTAEFPANVHLSMLGLLSSSTGLELPSLEDDLLVRKRRCRHTHGFRSGSPVSTRMGIVAADEFKIGLCYVETTVAW